MYLVFGFVCVFFLFFKTAKSFKVFVHSSDCDTSCEDFSLSFDHSETNYTLKLNGTSNGSSGHVGSRRGSENHAVSKVKNLFLSPWGKLTPIWEFE